MNDIIREEGYRPEQVELLGSKLLMGNGYVGCRGTLEEHRAQQLTALTMAGLFDQRGSDWREPVNAPDPFWVRAQFDAQPLSVLEQTPSEHSQWVDISCACQGRESVFAAAEVKALRFASLADRHLLALRYTVTARTEGDCRLVITPDCEIWDIHGPHLKDAALRAEEGALLYTASTLELGTEIALAQTVSCPEGTVELREDGAYITAHLAMGQAVTVYVYAALYKSTDPDWSDPVGAVKAARDAGFDRLLAAQRSTWAELWDQVKVTIRGDERADLALRYSMYLLLVSTPFHTDQVAIPARGLSGQVYKGAMFWDTELYMLPMYLASLPQAARNLVAYRIRTLDGARAKAREYGYRGGLLPLGEPGGRTGRLYGVQHQRHLYRTAPAHLFPGQADPHQRRCGLRHLGVLPLDRGREHPDRRRGGGAHGVRPVPVQLELFQKREKPL